jgi:hypothetical protein
VVRARALQATIRPPAVRNMYKAIWLVYIFAVSLWAAITFVGYWCVEPDVFGGLAASSIRLSKGPLQFSGLCKTFACMGSDSCSISSCQQV